MCARGHACVRVVWDCALKETNGEMLDLGNVAKRRRLSISGEPDTLQ